MFKETPPLQDGIYRALEQKPRKGLAQMSNLLPLTAQVYEPLWRGRSIGVLSGGDFSTERELALMGNWLAPRPNETVLDAAASAALYGRHLKRLEPTLSVHALDYSLPFLKTAKRYGERDGLELTLVQGDVQALPYQDAVFDAIACGGSLNEFTDLAKAVGEMARVLKPGGRAWFMYIRAAQDVPGRALQGALRLSGLRFIEAGGLEAIANAVGLRLLKAQYRGAIAMALLKREG